MANLMTRKDLTPKDLTNFPTISHKVNTNFVQSLESEKGSGFQKDK